MSPRLDKGTELNRPMTRKVVVLRDYGHGIAEVGLSNVPSPNSLEVDRRPLHNQPDLDGLPDERKDKANFDRSLRRTKATVRRKCMAGGLDHLLTLTYRQNVTDPDVAFADLKRFIRLVRKTHKSWKYVAVAEYQKRGAIHFHLAVRGFQNVRLLRARWLEVVGDGNIDIQAPKNKRRTVWDLPRLAGYVAKYIAKDTCAAFGKQRYRVAEGIELPKHRIILEVPEGVDMMQEVFDSIGADLGYRFQDERGWQWACSW